MDVRALLTILSILYLVLVFARALPVTQQKSGSDSGAEPQKSADEKKIESEIDDLGLEYGRYLQQVVEALEEDKEFAKKLENVSQEEIKNGAIARELNLVNHNVRNKLDELKRIEMDRLRALARKEQQLAQNGERAWRTVGAPIPNIEADHLDHANPHSFEAEDLQKLIVQATKDLEALDAKRREDFKAYEMEKELEFREHLVNMTDEEREKQIKEHEAAKHKEHPKIHHPGSKKQLEQVWEEKDGMPRQEFDPKVFFTVHDINGDGFLDPEEVEAILTIEVKKLYSDPNSDPNEMQEEYHRMREHIYKEADVNRDGLISKKEFLEFTRRMEFQQDEGWKGLDEQQVYSEEELKRFQQQRAQHPDQVAQQYAQYGAYQYQYAPQGGPQGGHHPQQQYQYVPVQQYIPPPQQMSPEQWHQLQQQYYQQQLHAQIPNPQLHQMAQQQQFHQQQQQQQQHFQNQMGGQPVQHMPPPQHMSVQDHPQAQYVQQVPQQGGQPIGHQGQVAPGQQIGQGHPQQAQGHPQPQQVHPSSSNH